MFACAIICAFAAITFTTLVVVHKAYTSYMHISRRINFM